MLHELPGVESMLPKVKLLAKRIKLYLYTTEIEPDTNITISIDKNCTIGFCDDCSDIFVTEQILYLPEMTISKLNNLQLYLQSVNLPYVFEHEALHLLDTAWYKKRNLKWTESLLELRATQIEKLLTKERY